MNSGRGCWHHHRIERYRIELGPSDNGVRLAAWRRDLWFLLVALLSVMRVTLPFQFRINFVGNLYTFWLVFSALHLTKTGNILILLNFIFYGTVVACV